MRIAALSLVMVVTLSIVCVPSVHAQTPAQPATAQPAPDFQRPDREFETEDLNRLKDQATDSNRGINRLQAMKVVPKFIQDSQLSCELTDVRQAGTGRTYVNGNAVGIESYEVDCSNGLGYILVSKNQQTPTIMSCFSMASANDAAIARGEKPSRRSAPVSCRLPANQDTKLMAGNLLKGLSATCTVNEVSTFGVNAKNHTEYVEVACDNNIGYVLMIPQLTNSTTPLSVMSCQDAARHSLQCKLTSNSSGPTTPPPVTMQTLYDALKQNGVSCTSPQLRLIGREATKKRYVVEARCPEQSGGLVAYIPLEDNSNKFETIDCNEALKRQITCQFTSK